MASDLRVLVVANEVPVPAVSGGRVDVFRRLRLLRQLGVRVALLAWYDEPRHGAPSEQAKELLRSICDATLLVPVRRTGSELLRRVFYLGREPSHVAARRVTLPRARTLAWAQDFLPDVMMLDGLYGASVVRLLAEHLRVKWIYRSHNVEHVYMRRQFERAKTWPSRLGLAANLLGLERFERAVLGEAECILDISVEDAEYWKAADKNLPIRWLPTVVDDDFAAGLTSVAEDDLPWDALYFGNLNTPNNVEAVRWLCRDVLGAIEGGTLRIAVAGSNPSDEVRALTSQTPGVELIPDPGDMAAVVRKSKVLVNPLLAGSGVNLKSVEMLFASSHLLSTPAGVRGLPEDAASCFNVANDPIHFGQMLARLAKEPAPDATSLARRRGARAAFTGETSGRILAAALAGAAAHDERD